MEKLTEDVLDVSRIEGKNLQLTKSFFDLNQTIKQVIEDHQKEALDKDVKISFESKNNVTNTIYADEARLQQVIESISMHYFIITGIMNQLTEEREHGQMTCDKRRGRKRIPDQELTKMIPRFLKNAQDQYLNWLVFFLYRKYVDSHGERYGPIITRMKRLNFYFYTPLDRRAKNEF